jgi:hypothetical protein
VSSRYTLPNNLSPSHLTSALYTALSRLISRHPALCCGIIGESGAKPEFIALESIDLKRSVQILADGGDGEVSDDERLCKVLQEQHDALWTDLDSRPGWKVIVRHLPRTTTTCSTDTSPQEPEPSRGQMDIFFIYHHALVDGLSGAAFHRCLLQELRNVAENPTPPDKSVETVVAIPQPISLIAPLENLVSFPLSWSFLLWMALRIFAPSWLFPNKHWTGANTQLPSLDAYRSHVRLVRVPATQLNILLAACRGQGVTMTALISSLAAVSIAKTLPAGESLKGVTPYSARRLTGTPVDEMVNQTSGFETVYPATLLSPLHDADITPDAEAEMIWKIARHYHTQMKAELARTPKDNLVGLLPLVSDYHAFYRGRLDQKRAESFEVSNLGVFKDTKGAAARGESATQKGGAWKIESMTFSQGAMVVGPALAFSCVSVEDGPLNITMTWQDGALEDGFGDEVVGKMQRFLMELR